MAMQTTSKLAEKPIRSMTDERLDFLHSPPLRKCYSVASSYRCGSTYLCSKLWETGVLGAPSEVLNAATSELRLLMTRFKAVSPSDYIAKLIAHRTSKNGIFGMKVHFHHFDAFLKEFPALLEVLSPMTYIYINRQDKVAQGVSMAKAMQTNRWSSRWEKDLTPPVHYDRDLIANCIKEVAMQDAGWQQWFDARKVTPYELTYEDLTADPAGTVRSIVELLGAQNDEREMVRVPPAEKQADETNQDWIARFKRETAAGGTGGTAGSAVPAIAAAAPDTAAPQAGNHFFDRYSGLIESLPEGLNSASGFFDAIRLRRRHDAIIEHNRDMLAGARVLDILSFEAFWSLAALDAGAAHVTAVETSAEQCEATKANLVAYGAKPATYEVVQAQVFTALSKFEPGHFDVVLCKGFFERCQPLAFFRHMSRLKPKHIILDTRVAAGDGGILRFSTTSTVAGQKGALVSHPTPELIKLLCGTDFQCRAIDLNSLGFTDWTGIHDYARGSHQIYILDRRG